jgi:predicted transcriptional regulator
MLIQQKPTAIKSLSVRTDEAAYFAIHELAREMMVTPSVVLRLAIVNLLGKQKRMQAHTIKELMNNEAA